MIHNQFCQSSSRPHIPHHFKWPPSIFQVSENVCHEITRGSFHCKNSQKWRGHLLFPCSKDSHGISRTGSEVHRSIFGGWTRTLNAFSLLDTLFLVFHQFIRWTQFVTDFTKQRNNAVVFTFGFDIVMRSHYFTKHTIDIFHNKRDLRIFCFPQTLAFTLMSIKFIKPQLIIERLNFWSAFHC